MSNVRLARTNHFTRKNRKVSKGQPSHLPIGAKIAIVIVIAAYSASLFLNALLEPSGQDHVPGWGALAFGVAGVFSGNFAWFANPLFLSSLLALQVSGVRRALQLSMAASAIACQSFVGFNGGGFFPTYSRNQLEFGFYVWLASLIALTICLLILLGISASKAETDSLPR